MVFAGYSGFPHYLQLAIYELATIGINVTKNEIQIQKFKLTYCVDGGIVSPIFDTSCQSRHDSSSHCIVYLFWSFYNLQQR